MTTPCTPPPGTASGTWHWLLRAGRAEPCLWEAERWVLIGAQGAFRPQTMANDGCAYLGSATPPAEVAQLRAEVERLRGALRRAADQFNHYAEQHMAKHTVEGFSKAAINRDMADLCRAALAPKEVERVSGDWITQVFQPLPVHEARILAELIFETPIEDGTTPEENAP